MVDEGAVPHASKSWLYQPVFPTHWQRCELYSLAHWVNGVAFRESQFSNHGKPIIKIAEIKGGISSQTRYTTLSFAESVHVSSGDLLFSWSGQPETSIDIFRWRGPDGWLNQHSFRVTPVDGIDSTFLFYLLRYLKPNFVGIARNKQTTGLGHVTKRDLTNIQAAYPDLAEQRAIAHILGTLDTKIELNRRRSDTLGEAARALFKAWFVDFEPVRARSEGRDPGLQKPLADLFSASFEESESGAGAVPAGWQVSGLDAVGRFLNGLALQRFPPQDDRSLPVIKIAQLRSGNTVGADAASIELQADYIVENGDVLFSWSGSLECVLWAGGRGALNQHLFKVTSDEYPKWFYYLWIHQHLPQFRHIAASKATTMGHIQRRHLSEAKVVIPPRDLLVAADRYIGPLLDATLLLRVQSQSLGALRDELLPRLLSGELRIKESEPFSGADT
jgi:type I restriction enzyme, S subunit